MSGNTSLIVLGCSATKFHSAGSIPAVHLYDGPIYRILRSHLRSYGWSHDLAVSVLSAKYGVIGGVAPIQVYDERMTEERAIDLRPAASSTLLDLSRGHRDVHLVLGKEYLKAVDTSQLRGQIEVHQADGPIGMKLHYLSQLLEGHRTERRILRRPEDAGRPLYFLPDWDDFLDQDFDFETDQFSAKARADRRQAHAIELLQPDRMCDGVLVSLAQHHGTKGLLRRLPLAAPELLRPKSVREHFGLLPNQWAFGDCGAFSYVNADEPSVTVDQAVAMYDLYDFDMGASVDHIPVAEIVADGKKIALTESERRRRIRVTRENADAFVRLSAKRRSTFTPVGVVQALDGPGYARQIGEYVEMGYSHVALGGLVPRHDNEIREIVQHVQKAVRRLRSTPWLHLLGIFRPKLQSFFRQAKIDSFDSASYFRKAWLRSDQNYLGCDGKWYAAIRVPPTSDPRTLLRLRTSGESLAVMQEHEQTAIAALQAFDCGAIGIDMCLNAVLTFDRLLDRADAADLDLREQYRRTLEARPWLACRCNICAKLGIHVVIFRGSNRNKRRGAHNTLRLYASLTAARDAERAEADA